MTTTHDFAPDVQFDPTTGEPARTFRVGTTTSDAHVNVTVRLRNEIGSPAMALSITGDVQRPRAHDIDAGGQILDVLRMCEPYGTWTREAIDRLVFVWDLWHLNDMRAGCAHQLRAGWTYADHEDIPECPFCGYRIGSRWLHEPLPLDVAIYVLGLLTAEDPASVGYAAP
jgi:hypothetical protein